MDQALINQVLTLVAIGLFGWDIWQLSASRKNKEIQLKEKQLHISQVKIWQHFANGINHNLLMLSEAIRTNKLDKLKASEFGEVLKGIQASANALYTSLNEERLFTDEEIKQRQLDNEKQFKTMLEGSSAHVSQSPSASKRV
jgi:hypothetical protein